jgi:hypothetical protein
MALDPWWKSTCARSRVWGSSASSLGFDAGVWGTWGSFVSASVFSEYEAMGHTVRIGEEWAIPSGTFGCRPY